MNTKEKIINSTKYSLNGGLNFLFLGILMVSLDIVTKIYEKNIILSIILIIILLVFSLIEAGYLANIIEYTMDGSEKLPDFKDFKYMLKKGLDEIIILTVYFIVPTLIVGIIILTTHNEFIVTVLIMLWILTMIFSSLFFQAAILNYEYKHGQLKAGFDIKIIFLKIKKMGLSKFIITFTMIILIYSIFESTTTHLSKFLPENIEFILNFTLYPFLAIFSSRFLGLIGREHFIE